MLHVFARLASGYSFIAGVISAIGSVLLTVQFWQAAIIAGITGLLAAVGTVLGAVIASRLAARIAEPIARDVEHIKRAGGLTRRASDEERK